MLKSKLTLIVDGNWLLMSRLSVLNNRYKDDMELNHELKLLMIKSINVVLRTFPMIDNVIFVADGGSWRNKINIPVTSIISRSELRTLIPIDKLSLDLDKMSNEEIYEKYADIIDSFHPIEYKGTRSRSDDFNWDLLFSSYEDFMTTLSSTGITVTREKDIEGDDWCWYWSTKLNNEGTNVIIWSKDKDLTQLVNMDKNKCFTVWWNKDSGVITSNTPEEEMNWLFNLEYNTNEEIFSKICNIANKVTSIDKKEVIINKILKGDPSDNILPILIRKSKTPGGKQYKISNKDINYDLDIHNQNNITNYFTNLINSKSYKDRVHNTVNEAVDHFNYNRRLVTLEQDSYPEYVLETMSKYDDYNISKNLSIAESQIKGESVGLVNILNTI